MVLPFNKDQTCIVAEAGAVAWAKLITKEENDSTYSITNILKLQNNQDLNNQLVTSSKKY